MGAATAENPQRRQQLGYNAGVMLNIRSLLRVSAACSNSSRELTGRALRQKRTITILAVLLIIGGLAVLFLVQRMPLPMRLLVGLTDVFAGLTLLVLVRQKFSGRNSR